MKSDFDCRKCFPAVVPTRQRAFRSHSLALHAYGLLLLSGGTPLMCKDSQQRYNVCAHEETWKDVGIAGG
jgi:hypothetical protein